MRNYEQACGGVDMYGFKFLEFSKGNLFNYILLLDYLVLYTLFVIKFLHKYNEKTLVAYVEILYKITLSTKKRKLREWKDTKQTPIQLIEEMCHQCD